MCLTSTKLNHMFGNSASRNYIAQPRALHKISVDLHLASTCLREPLQSDNKYSRGVLGVITGSNEYPGAAVLSTKAASYSNIGMVKYSGPMRAQNLVLNSAPEALVSEQLQEKVDAITVGSGIPDSEHCNDENTKLQRKYIASILSKYVTQNQDENTQSESQSALPPVCVDAGALDLLPEKVCEKVILTPHAGELSSLFERYGLEISAKTILENPTLYAKKAADLTNATVLVKGSATAVASPSKIQAQTYIAQYAPSWLATAGSGDVLSGILGALLAQRENNKNYALIAASAALIHGVAGVLASQSSNNDYMQLVQNMLKSKKPLLLEHPIVASDIIATLPYIFGILINIK